MRAHNRLPSRTPTCLASYASSTSSGGLRLINSGADRDAHLSGIVAAQTALPTVNVSVKGCMLDGINTLHRALQLPCGMSNIVFVVGNAVNTGAIGISREDAVCSQCW